MAGKQADIKVGVITNYDDKGLKQAETGLKKIKSAIADADGVGAKFKAGASSAFESVGGAVKGMAIASAAGFVAFGQDIINAGVKMASMDAKAKTVFGDSLAMVQKWADGNAAAMGLTSRAAVGAAAGIQDLLVPMGFAREEATDMSLKLLDLGGALSAWSGGTKSAAEVSQIFAKAMLGERDELKSLGISISEADVSARLAVKGQQSLTGAALQQAKALATQELIYEKSTDAQKAWSDGSMDATKSANEAKAGFSEMSETLNESLYPAISQLIPPLVVVVDLAAKVSKLFGAGGIAGGGFREATDAMRDMRGQIEAAGLDFGDLEQKVIAEGLSVEELTKIVTDAKAEFDKLHGTLREGEKSWETQTEWLGKQAEAAAETDRETRRLTEGMKGGTEAFEDAKPPIDNASRALETFRTTVAGVDLAYSALTGKLDEEEAWEKVNEKIKEFGKGTKASDEEIRNITRDIADYVVNTDTIPATKKTEIIALLDEGKLEYAKAVLAEVTKNRDIYLNLIAAGSGDIIAKLGAVGHAAEGGIVKARSGGQLIVAGEAGHDEAIIPLDGQHGMGGVSIANLTINMPPGSDGNAIVRELKKFERRNGPGWRAS